jgi:sugar phosphate isomerase/epimerase
VRLGLVTEPFVARPLPALLDWLRDAAPAVTAIEVGAGGYAPPGHCDRHTLLASAAARRRYLDEIEGRGFRLAALNVWGNPLHHDRAIAGRHDADLREAVRLAAELGVDRVIALAGCPPAEPGDAGPHFAAGGWLPYLEGVFERQWERVAAPYWAGVAEFAAGVTPDLAICVELHPGTCVYNVETFERLARLGPNLAANVDPSHFVWQGMDAPAVVGALTRIGHAHAKDALLNPAALATAGLLDHRWAGDDPVAPWRFAAVGRAQDARWWAALCAALEARGVPTLAIEHEDPAVAADVGVPESARVLAGCLALPRQEAV